MNAVHVFPSPPAARHVQVHLDVGPQNTLWVTLPESIDGNPPYFSPPLIDDLMGMLQLMKQRGAVWPAQGQLRPIHYTVMNSAHPEYFNLGGDLAHFHDCIQRRDREALHRYSLTCADMLFEWSSALGKQATSIALVQGRALGGGFETALAADFIVAEEHSEFGFPEILFGLFPCTGGMSLLAQRIGARAAERMLGDGRVYSAAALKEMGVRYVISKALDDHAKQVLLRIGADEVVMPEFQFGRWVAERMVLGSIKAIQEVEPGVLLGAIDCAAEVAGRSLEELNLPKAITVLLVTGGDRTTPMPPPTLRLVAGDTIWLMGDANAFHAIRAFKQQTQ